MEQQRLRHSRENEELQAEYAVQMAKGILRQLETKRSLHQTFSETEAEVEALGHLRMEGVHPRLIPAAAQMVVSAYIKR